MENCVQNSNDSCKKAPDPFIKLWVLTYTNTDDATYQGMAVVSAEDVHTAIQVFKTSCMHNGYINKIRIGRIDQIPYPIVRTLVMENYVKVFE